MPALWHNCRGGTGYQAGTAEDCKTCAAYEQAGVDFRRAPAGREVAVMAVFLEQEAKRWSGGHGKLLAECAEKLRAHRPVSRMAEVAEVAE